MPFIVAGDIAYYQPFINVSKNMEEKIYSKNIDRIIDPKVDNAFAEKYGERSYIAPELIEALREGDSSAFEKLYTHMGGPLEDFLTTILHSREDAREVAQEIFAKVWEHRATISSGKNFKGYLFSSAKNLALDLLRRRKVELKYLSIEVHTPEGVSYSADELIQARELETLLRMTLDTMPEKKRRVFEMSRLEGKTKDEIAKELGLTKETVYAYLSSVLKELGEVAFFVIFFLSA